MSTSSTVHAESADVTTRLSQLGLQEETLRTAMSEAMSDVFACTSHDPPMLAGMLGWGKGVRSLRDQLVRVGWVSRNVRNYATVEHPTGVCAITVAAGDAYTGREDRNPSTRSAKGPATEDAIENNQRELADVSQAFPRVKGASPTQTWILLYHSDDERDEVRLELSLPAGMTKEGHVSVWTERVILAPILSPPASDVEEESEDEQIDVPVVPRAG